MPKAVVGWRKLSAVAGSRSSAFVVAVVGGGGDAAAAAAAAAAAGDGDAGSAVLMEVDGRNARGVGQELSVVALELVRRDAQREVDPQEEVHLELIQLLGGDSAHARVEGVVEVEVVEELGRDHDARDDHAVDVQLRQHEVVALDQPVDVHQGQDEARRRAPRVLVYPGGRGGGGGESAIRSY